MGDLFTVEQVLAALYEDTDQPLEDEESDYEGEGIFSYGLGGIAELGLEVGGEDFQEEEEAIFDEEDTAQLVPTESRDQADGEY